MISYCLHAEDIGDDFLGSWKSMSVMEVDRMDFSFNTGPKGKKKVFDFEKLDMEFNLDVDMSDLDFSRLPNKAAKTKERSKEEPSRGSRQGTQDHFKFSFDFNELDNFDLDSTLTTRGKSSKKNQDSSKEVVSDTAGCEGSSIWLKGIVHSTVNLRQ
ncbi:hypothetical protein M0R45_014083 [Rubus argutus]|uniref:Uncharacterized protein n=1 Tax=Rubus argutus TaxID=59490 RepID=A0AAW1XL71_RUBAR